MGRGEEGKRVLVAVFWYQYFEEFDQKIEIKKYKWGEKYALLKEKVKKLESNEKFRARVGVFGWVKRNMCSSTIMNNDYYENRDTCLLRFLHTCCQFLGVLAEEAFAEVVFKRKFVAEAILQQFPCFH